MFAFLWYFADNQSLMHEMYKLVVIYMCTHVSKCTSLCAKLFYWMRFMKENWISFRCPQMTLTFVRHTERLWKRLIYVATVTFQVVSWFMKEGFMANGISFAVKMWKTYQA